MGWTWQLARSDGIAAESVSATQPAGGFPSQGEAETWVGEVWRDLLDDGVDAVTLFEDGRRVYGPMSLHPPQ
ncbi:MAG: hypothetical protein WCF04_12325 [Candidatus Nanopelagicales bacterium]